MAKRFEGLGGAWRVVKVGPGLEGKVGEALGQHGLQTYVPTETYWRGLKGRRAVCGRPLIRGYVFALLPDEATALLHEIRSCRLMMINGEAVRVPIRLLLAFQAREAAGDFDETLTERQRAALLAELEPGMKVRVTGGPFAGFLGSVTRLSGQRRAVLLIAMFGRLIPAQVDRDNLELDDDYAELNSRLTKTAKQPVIQSNAA